MSVELVHKELSEDIIGAAMTVLNALKPGLDEKIYENALVIELRKRAHKIDQQRKFPVYYDGQWVGTLVPDLIVDEERQTRLEEDCPLKVALLFFIRVISEIRG